MSNGENNAKHALILLWITAMLAFTAFPQAVGLLTRQDTLSTSGVLAGAGVGIYSDAACTQNLTLIDWGLIYPGETYTVTCYLKNLGNIDTALTINTLNWAPPLASTYLTFQTDYAGQTLQPDAVLPLTVTLHASEDTAGFDAFSFDITVTVQG
jgi:hypothetical protein